MEPCWKIDREGGFYEDYIMEAGGEFDIYSAPPSLFISIRVRSPKDFTIIAFLIFLRRTSEQLSKYQLLYDVDRTTEPLFNELAQRGEIEWHRSGPYARLTRLHPNHSNPKTE